MTTLNAIELLKKDHQEVRELLDQLVGTTSRAAKKRQELLQKIDFELKVHTQLEEEIFYPAFRDAGGKEHKQMFFEAVEEHRAVEKLVLPDLKKTDPTSDQFAGRAKVLKELIEHHAGEEEEEMFAAAESTMTEESLLELGKQMQDLQKKLKQKMQSR